MARKQRSQPEITALSTEFVVAEAPKVHFHRFYVLAVRGIPGIRVQREPADHYKSARVQLHLLTSSNMLS